jgi:hypothetical protein
MWCQGASWPIQLKAHKEQSNPVEESRTVVKNSSENPGYKIVTMPTCPTNRINVNQACIRILKVLLSRTKQNRAERPHSRASHRGLQALLAKHRVFVSPSVRPAFSGCLVPEMVNSDARPRPTTCSWCAPLANNAIEAPRGLRGGADVVGRSWAPVTTDQFRPTQRFPSVLLRPKKLQPPGAAHR